MKHVDANSGAGRKSKALPLLLVLFFAFGLVRPSACPPAVVPPTPTNADFSVRSSGKNLELVTPYGTKILPGDYGNDATAPFRLEIPLDELRPPVAKEASKETGKDAAKDGNAAASATGDGSNATTAEAANKKDAVAPEYDDTDRLILEANHLYNRRKFYEASVYVEEIVRKKPKFLRGWVMKGSLLYMQGEKELAHNAWKQALTLQPDNREVLSLLERYR